MTCWVMGLVADAPPQSLILQAAPMLQPLTAQLPSALLMPPPCPSHLPQCSEYETWLVSEYADRGSLADAIKRGQFKADDQAGCCDMVGGWVLGRLQREARAVQQRRSELLASTHRACQPMSCSLCPLQRPTMQQPAVLLCLLDVARGLEYLHSCSIVHGGEACVVCAVTLWGACKQLPCHANAMPCHAMLC